MRNLKILLLLAAVGIGSLNPCQARQPYLATQCSASTNPNPAYVISVEVTIINQGKEASSPGKVELTCTPRAPRRPKSEVPTMWDPISESQDLPELQPGERKSFTFKTQYFASSPYRGTRGTFKASNIDPTGVDVQVTPSVKIQN